MSSIIRSIMTAARLVLRIGMFRADDGWFDEKPYRIGLRAQPWILCRGSARDGEIAGLLRSV